MCTLEKRGDIYILTLTGPDEHRLNPTLVDSIRSALRRVRAEPASPSSALVTIAEGKFFSNGFDLAWAHSSQPRLELKSITYWTRVAGLIRGIIEVQDWRCHSQERGNFDRSKINGTDGCSKGGCALGACWSRGDSRGSELAWGRSW